MSLEQALKDNTAALTRFCDVMEKSGIKAGAAAGAGAATTTTTTTTAAKDKPGEGAWFEPVKAKAAEAKEKLGVPATRKIIAEAGKADALTKVLPANGPALIAAFDAALTGGNEDDI